MASTDDVGFAVPELESLATYIIGINASIKKDLPDLIDKTLDDRDHLIKQLQDSLDVNDVMIEKLLTRYKDLVEVFMKAAQSRE